MSTIVPRPLPLPSTLMPPPATTTMPHPRKRDPSSSPGDDDDETEEDYQPGPSKRPAKRANTSRSSGTVSANGAKHTKMSREALRKANHSLIERRRREKINFALGELRSMVPGLGDDKGGKAGEFKLEVLERTVEHMKELKAELADLQARVAKTAIGDIKAKRSATETQVAEDRSRSKHRKTTTASTTPPSPSLSPERKPRAILVSKVKPSESPDPDETETDESLIPHLTHLARTSSSSTSSPSHPSISSLLNSSNQAHQLQRQPSRPPAPPEAANPTLYLPFPTPSPTSPFLTYSGASSVTSTSGTGIAMEPSPFMAPLQNFSLFGGALSLDSNPSPEVSMTLGRQGPPDLSMPPPRGKELKRIPSPEEAANLLLAFSSPDTLRPVSGGTPIFAPIGNGRRGTLDSEEFMLDGSAPIDAQARQHGHSHSHWPKTMVGKTARDILRM